MTFGHARGIRETFVSHDKNEIGTAVTSDNSWTENVSIVSQSSILQTHTAPMTPAQGIKKGGRVYTGGGKLYARPLS